MRWTVVAAIFFTTFACKRATGPVDAGAGTAAAPPVSISREALAQFLPTSPDGGSEPRNFAGFSSDEERFAWTAYSVGAGAHVLTIRPVGGEGRVNKLLLDGEEAVSAAKRTLEEGGFTPVRRVPKEDSVRVELEGGRVRLLRITPDGTRQRFYEGEPFSEESRGFAIPVHASFWGLSPSGRLAVLEVVTADHPEFGSATNFIFIPLRFEEVTR